MRNLVTNTAAELRRAFDQSFAEPPSSETAAFEDLLDVRLGAMACALRVTEISGLYADMNIAALPTLIRELIGIAGFRGAILPVYDLRAVLGFPFETKPRWLAIAGGTPVGLAFDGFEGHLRVRRDAIVPQGRGETVVRHVRDVVALDGVARPLVSIPSVLEALTSRARGGPAKE